MAMHPVHLRIEPSANMARVHVVIRLALLLALGALGLSSLYWLLYLVLPAIAALVLSQRGAQRYLSEDGPPIVRVLRWLAGAYAYLWLLTDAFPTSEAGGAVDLEVDVGGSPTPSSALLRLLNSLPALLILVLLSLAAGIIWLIGAIVILIRKRMPAALANFLALTLRYQFRLAAFHLSLVDRYPSFEEESSQHAAATAR
jgi:hypothetical protein